MIALGSRARDIVTGFEGIVSGRYDFLTGCTRYQLTPPAKKDGTLPETMAFDESSLEVIDAGVSKKFFPTKEQPSKTGGPEVYKCKNIYV